MAPDEFDRCLHDRLIDRINQWCAGLPVGSVSIKRAAHRKNWENWETLEILPSNPSAAALTVNFMMTRPHWIEMQLGHHATLCLPTDITLNQKTGDNWEDFILELIAAVAVRGFWEKVVLSDGRILVIAFGVALTGGEIRFRRRRLMHTIYTIFRKKSVQQYKYEPYFCQSTDD